MKRGINEIGTDLEALHTKTAFVQCSHDSGRDRGLADPAMGSCNQNAREAHGILFKYIGSPATVKMTSSAASAAHWFKNPCVSRKARVTAGSGTVPQPSSLETRMTWHF